MAALEGHDADIPTEDQTAIPTYHIFSRDERGISSAAAQSSPPAAVEAHALGGTASTGPLSTDAEAIAPRVFAAPVDGKLTSGTSMEHTVSGSQGLPEQGASKAPEAANSSAPEANLFTDPEKMPFVATAKYTSLAPAVSSSTGPELQEKKSAASSDNGKEVDLEAGQRSSSSSKKEPEVQQSERDPNIVDWDGPEDPANPINWSEALKWGNVAVVSSITFLTQVTHHVLGS